MTTLKENAFIFQMLKIRLMDVICFCACYDLKIDFYMKKLRHERIALHASFCQEKAKFDLLLVQQKQIKSHLGCVVKVIVPVIKSALSNTNLTPTIKCSNIYNQSALCVLQEGVIIRRPLHRIRFLRDAQTHMGCWFSLNIREVKRRRAREPGKNAQLR